jgi:hypothetical protein
MDVGVDTAEALAGRGGELAGRGLVGEVDLEGGGATTAAAASGRERYESATADPRAASIRQTSLPTPPLPPATSAAPSRSQKSSDSNEKCELIAVGFP